jgi:hypothetical protein
MAFVYRKQLGSRALIVLLPYLILVSIQEISITIIRQNGGIYSTAIIYNIYRPISAIVFAWIYYQLPFMLFWKKFIVAIIILYLILTLINYSLIESIFSTSSYLAVARGLVITLFAIFFLFSYFNLDNTAEEKYWRPLIWITAGVIIFYPVASISLTFQKFLASKNATLFSQKLYHLIPQVMSIFMYSCFSYAFYLCYRIKRHL